MDNSPPSNKTYVVYNGRKTGVYYSWIDCYAQVNGWKESVVRIYDSKMEASNAWRRFINAKQFFSPKKDEIESFLKGDHGYFCEIIDKIEVPRVDDGRVHQYKDGEILIENQSMQNVLRDACKQLRIEQPLYHLHHFKDYGNRRHYQYRGSIQNKSMGKHEVSMGKYARTEFDAREDVAVLLLRRLLAGTRKKILDYNQRNVELVEYQLQRACDCNFDLRLENHVLNEELRILRATLEESRRE